MSFDSRETSVESGQPVKLYEFQLGNTRWRYTAGDRVVIYGTQTFEPLAISDDGVRQTGQTSADEFTIRMPANCPVVELFRGAPTSNEVYVVVRERHHGETDARVYFNGSVRGMRRRSPESAELKCESNVASLDRAGLRLGYSRNCTHTIYDAGCGVSPALHKYNGVVTAVTGATIEAAAWDVPADGFFAGGYVEWPIGGGEYERRGVDKHVGGVLTVIGGADGIAVGVTVAAFPGCPRTIAVCDSRFANAANFGGFPKIPGKSPFDGTPVL